MNDKSRFFSNIEFAENALKFSEQLKYHADILSKTVAYITSKIESFGIQVHDEQLITKRVQEIFYLYGKSIHASAPFYHPADYEIGLDYPIKKALPKDAAADVVAEREKIYERFENECEKSYGGDIIYFTYDIGEGFYLRFLIKNIPWQEDPVPHSFNLHLSVNFDEMFKASQAQILDKQVQKQLTQNLTDKPAT